jgi:hypothetical protein
LLAPPPEPPVALGLALAVTTTVCPPIVTTDWVADGVVDGDVFDVADGADPSELLFEMVPSRLSEVRYTDVY